MEFHKLRHKVSPSPVQARRTRLLGQVEPGEPVLKTVMSASRRADGLRGTRMRSQKRGSRGFRILGGAPKHYPRVAFPMHMGFPKHSQRIDSTLEGRRMMKIVGCVTVAFAFAALAVAPALAQSSGNFTYGSNGGTTHCVLDRNGQITGGQICQQDCTLQADGTVACTGNGHESGLRVGGFGVGIKTNSGSGNVFVMRPSAVIGLLTDVSLVKNSATSIGSSSALAGVDFSVDVSPKPAQVIPNYPVTYASRFVQISSNLFDVLSTTCTTISPTNPTGSCFFSFNECTVSAHSFDLIATVLAVGQYAVTVNCSSSHWTAGISRALTCVGPVNLTVTQNKVFLFNRTNAL